MVLMLLGLSVGRHTRCIDRRLNRSEVIIACRTRSLLHLQLLRDVDLGVVGWLLAASIDALLALGTVALEEGGNLVLLVTVVAIHAVTSTFITHIRVIAPLLRARSSS